MCCIVCQASAFQTGAHAASWGSGTQSEEPMICPFHIHEHSAVMPPLLPRVQGQFLYSKNFCSLLLHAKGYKYIIIYYRLYITFLQMLPQLIFVLLHKKQLHVAVYKYKKPIELVETLWTFLAFWQIWGVLMMLNTNKAQILGIWTSLTGTCRSSEPSPMLWTWSMAWNKYMAD